MPITAQSPDGVLHQFPDGTPDAVVDRAMQDYIKTPATNDNGGILKNVGAGLASAVSGAADLAENIVPGFAVGKDVANLVLSHNKPGQQVMTAGHAVNSLLPDAINPEKVTQKTFPEKLARGVGAGLSGALIPGAEGYTVGQMLANAALGATSGAGAATGAEVMPDRFKPLGAALGGIVAPMAAVGAVNAVGAAARGIKSAATGFTSAGPEQTVGKILAQAAGGEVPDMAAAPLPGMQPTAGQASGNAGLLSLERSVEQTPAAAIPAASSRTASNTAVMDAVQKLGDTEAPAAENMLDALEKSRDQARKLTQNAWKAAGIDDATPLNIAPLKQDVQGFMDGLTRSGKAKLPGNLTGVFDDFGDTEPLREIQDWRSDLSTAFRAARKDGDANGMRILGGLQDKVDDFLDDLAGHRSDTHLNTTPDDMLREEELAGYQIARASTRADKEAFAQPGSPVRKALSVDEFGQASESNTANLFVRPQSSAGAPEAFDSYMKALKRTGDPAILEQGKQAVRDAFAQKFQDAISGVSDAQGNVTIKPAAVQKFVDNYDHIIQSDIFTPDQRNLIDRINDAAEMSARTARAGAKGGSDTYAKFASKNWVDALVGAGTKRVARTAGATLGYATGGPVGAAAGAYGAPKIMETMLSANKEAATQLLTKALYDPALAKELMKSATAANAAKISLPLQARIYSALLGKQTSNDNAMRKSAP